MACKIACILLFQGKSVILLYIYGLYVSLRHNFLRISMFISLEGNAILY